MLLESELQKWVVKFGPTKKHGYRHEVEFFIMYASPAFFQLPQEGIVAAVYRAKPDVEGKQGMAIIISQLQPWSEQGLARAREIGITFAKKQYRLPAGIHIVETATQPDTDSIAYDVLYRYPRPKGDLMLFTDPN